MLQGIKRTLLALVFLGVCVAVGLTAYHQYLRKVRIAFVGFRDTSWASFEEIGRKTTYALHRLDREQITGAPLSSYNAVFLWGMGLILGPEQLQALERARQANTKIIPVSATNALSEKQGNLTKEQQETVDEYLKHGGDDNLLALLHYVARECAGKDAEVSAVVPKPTSGFFHLGDAIFETLEEFEKYRAQHGPELSADAPRIAIVGAFVDPTNKYDRPHLDYFIRSFERQGVRVYPIFGFRKATELLKQVKPDFAVVFPHGRLSSDNKTPKLLVDLDIPCASALSIFTSTEEWLTDERGMSGGMLGQSITMPELDGVIEPIAITAQEPNERRIRVRTLIDDRIEKFVARTLNWLELRRKPNAKKRVVIVYYKAPGLSSLTASGLETVPSLWNLLQRLQKEGYDLGDALPETPDALFDLIQKKGKTLGQWAIGSYEQFLQEAQPELIPAETYAQWFAAALSPKRQKEMIELWDAVPGKQMVTLRDDKPHLVVSRIQMGNVVIMPQPTVGGGNEDEDEVKSIHGTDKAPPHFYLGAYLWAQRGFQADAIIHFGTHGSLEFTYGKSACLSRDCWPDILIGELPHIYPYIINNVGEALVAKRRSYGVLISHLTPPFTASGLYGQLSLLQQKLDAFETEADPLLKRETRKTISRMVRELDLAKDVDLAREPSPDDLLTDEEIHKIDQLIHETEAKTITDGLHVLGRPFTDEQIASTVTSMLGEQGYDTLLAATGHPDNASFKAARQDVARELVDGVLAGSISAEQFFSAAQLQALRDAQQEAIQKDADLTSPNRKGKQKEKPADAHLSRDNQAGRPAGKQDHKAQKQIKDFWGTKPADRPAIVEDRKLQLAFLDVLDNIRRYAEGLRDSPRRELDHIVKALRGGYIEPCSGGDPLFNPESVPTARNLYSINAEQTPTEEAWRVGKLLAGQILARHKAETGHWPRQAAFTLWGGASSSAAKAPRWPKSCT